MVSGLCWQLPPRSSEAYGEPGPETNQGGLGTVLGQWGQRPLPEIIRKHDSFLWGFVLTKTTQLSAGYYVLEIFQLISLSEVDKSQIIGEKSFQYGGWFPHYGIWSKARIHKSRHGKGKFMRK